MPLLAHPTAIARSNGDSPDGKCSEHGPATLTVAPFERTAERNGLSQGHRRAIAVG